MRPYKPRRAGKRWLEGAPDYILDEPGDSGDYCDDCRVNLRE